MIVDDDFYDDDSDDFYFYPVHGSVSSRFENYAKTKKTFSIRYSLFFGPPSLPEHIIFRLSETGTIVNLTWFQCSEHSQWNEVKGLDGQFHTNPLYFVTPGITKTKIDLIIIFLLREKIDLKTSFSTPIHLPSPPWTKATFSWFGTGLRKVHNYDQEVTSACTFITVKRIRYQDLPDRPRLIEDVLYGVNLSLMTHSFFDFIVYPGDSNFS